jgi:hypothetical protein
LTYGLAEIGQQSGVNRHVVRLLLGSAVTDHILLEGLQGNAKALTADDWQGIRKEAADRVQTARRAAASP